MTTSVGPALPGFASTRSASEQSGAGTKNADTGFNQVLHGAGKQAGSEKHPTAETAPRDQRWGRPTPTGRAATDGKDEPAPADPRKIASAKSLLAKAAKDAADAAAGEEGDDAGTAEQVADTSALQDHLPLLMALHDLRHFSASAKADNAASGDSAMNPPLDGQNPLSKKYRATADAANRMTGANSRRGATAVSSLAEGESQQPNGIRLPSGPMNHDDGLTSLPLPEGVTDTTVRPASPLAKNIDEALSSVRSEAGKQASSANRIEVVSERSFPAPAQNPMSQAAAAVIDAINTDRGLRQAVSTTPATPQATASVAGPAHILKIELHPAELGMVTASLRLSGEQLSIELKPQTHEAYRRLASDSETIVKSLRGLGFEVDKVTILQPSIAVPAATRSDASANPQAMSGRDPSSFQSGNSSGNNGGGAGQQPGRNRNDDPQEFGRPASPSRERAGGDMFI